MSWIVRLRFAGRYAFRHFLISLLVATLTAAFVFGMLYPPPYQAMLQVGGIYVIVLAVDVVCGPLLTLVLSSPKKSRRERWLDFGVIGVLQMAALLYGLHAVWQARPAVLAFEVDRLLVVTANEVQTDTLALAPESMQHLPWWGLLHINIRSPSGPEETLRSVDLGLAGISPAMLPDWWLPWETAQTALARKAKPVADLLQRRPQSAAVVNDAIAATRLPATQLRYIPLTSSKTKDWVVLLDENLNIVGYAPVDGF